MHQPERSIDPVRDSLALEAFRYATGELDHAATAAFEDRLAADQDAREALAQAVRVATSQNDSAPAGPDPAYRASVCRRLRGLGQPV